MRHFWVYVHRYVGLFMALFLVFTGLTGAVISWDHELDHWLNPQLTKVKTIGPALSSIEIAKQVESRYPQVIVNFIPLFVESGESLEINVSPRVNPTTGRLYETGFNQVFIDPVTGTELGKREWGAIWPITRETFVSFLYKLHFSLQIPEMWGTDRWGIWLLGGVAILWTLDSFIGFYLTLPAGRKIPPRAALLTAGRSNSWRQRWWTAWKIRWRGGASKLNFDLHRAVSLWTWGLLFIIAFTAFSLNLYREVFYPMMSVVSKVTPSPFETRPPTALHQPIIPVLNLAKVIAKAEREAKARGWDEPAGAVFYAPNFGIYGVQFFYPEDEKGSGGVGHKQLYYDGNNGQYLGDRQPWKGTAADIFVQAQFPLHSGRILGLPGRIIISVMGIVVAMLSITGAIVWWRKRNSRREYGLLRQRNAI
ncbi:MAG: PepSY-associated TM helix domain-containing protein [Methylophilaceae bacterium]|nr:PepSY-associated TM helix domain-containing protein [Methyloradius sp.]